VLEGAGTRHHPGDAIAPGREVAERLAHVPRALGERRVAVLEDAVPHLLDAHVYVFDRRNDLVVIGHYSPSLRSSPFPEPVWWATSYGQRAALVLRRGPGSGHSPIGVSACS